ncbi:hypothetical protein SISSUDRAFT_1058109 [Sistotremastrum suecicum HHB10207 ss-3]|uniref:Uncharacterized protein n=1 Tax=Sistotremastrum suecicum HHB10207 ss-3 TaxID=1314776 RepID=A0A166HQI9_9AGAM|nr:hypothetical protein SISSUDRAFT_1058109 [Sistotremastrum suecicum HHB10207 ss-3]
MSTTVFPLVPTLALALVSFFSSCFVVIQILLPILPPNPLSRRVRPSEFGLPNFRSMSITHKGHLWLSLFDLVALGLFIWEVLSENVADIPFSQDALDTGSSIRLCLALTIRQLCLAFIILLTLVHVRMGRTSSFGPWHVLLWSPVLVMAATSAVVSGLLAHYGVPSLFEGLIAFSSALSLGSLIMFCCLVGTLVTIRNNLMPRYEPERVAEEKLPRPSFATDEIDALREGSSWITSTTGSRRGSISAFSFSTYHSALPSTTGSGRNPFTGSAPSLAPKSSFWFSPLAGSQEEIPPVPPLPSPYRNGAAVATSTLSHDADPFRRDVPERIPKTSSDSWLTSPAGSVETMTAFSFPTTAENPIASSTHLHELDAPRPSTTAYSPTPAFASAKVLGGYGYDGLSEKGISVGSSSTKDLNVSSLRAALWVAMILLPMVLSMPFLAMVIVQPTMPSVVPAVLFVISVTISSPLLSIIILCKAPLPIPRDLFSPPKGGSGLQLGKTYKQSFGPSLEQLRPRGISVDSVTVVEGRRSGDVWIAQGDAVDGKGKLGRALGLLKPSPRLAVLPIEEDNTRELTPPLPLQMGESHPSTPQSAFSAEMGRMRGGSEQSTYQSAMADSLAYGSHIMVAQKHYSAMAKTMVLEASPTKTVASSVPQNMTNKQQHLRSRSTSSVSHRAPMTPPPSEPLPPTPGTARHERSESSGRSSGFSFSPVHGSHQVDSLSAGMLPLLVSGLKVGTDVEITPFSERDSRGPKESPTISDLFGSSFSSPDSHSTPIRKKSSFHRRGHYSLPSLGLPKDGHASFWKTETNKALENTGESQSDIDLRRATVIGLENIPSTLSTVREETNEASSTMPAPPNTNNEFARPRSSMSFYPSGVDSARSSLLTLINALDAEAQVTQAATAFTSEAFVAATQPQPVDVETEGVRNFHLPTQNRKQSSIKYARSDDSHDTEPQRRSSATTSSIPIKRTQFRRPDGELPKSKLRPLSLLQEREIDINISSAEEVSQKVVTPLSIKKTISRGENAGALRPLKLSRSATAKARGLLRKNEILPAVVVRPPSGDESAAFSWR